MLDISVFLLNYLGRDAFLWLLWRSCYLDELFFMNSGPLKVKDSSFPSCCIKNVLTPLLLSPHPSQYSFRYGIDEVLGLWYDMGWYCWLAFLCMHWFWFNPLRCLNVFPKFRLNMGSIMEWAVDISTSIVSRVQRLL